MGIGRICELPLTACKGSPNTRIFEVALIGCKA